MHTRLKAHSCEYSSNVYAAYTERSACGVGAKGNRLGSSSVSAEWYLLLHSTSLNCSCRCAARSAA